eukprot:943176-Pleurochrysis_carterae.AAC.5
MSAAEFVRSLEATMEGVGRVTAMLAETAGSRPQVISALTSADLSGLRPPTSGSGDRLAGGARRGADLGAGRGLPATPAAARHGRGGGQTPGDAGGGEARSGRGHRSTNAWSNGACADGSAGGTTVAACGDVGDGVGGAARGGCGGLAAAMRARDAERGGRGARASRSRGGGRPPRLAAGVATAMLLGRQTFPAASTRAACRRKVSCPAHLS